MLINNLHFNGTSLDSITDELLQNLTKQEFTLLKSYIISTPTYAESFQKIIRQAPHLCDDINLASILDLITDSYKRYKKTTRPTITDLSTEILKHENAGENTLKAYYAALIAGVNGPSSNNGDKSLLRRMRNEPVLPQHVELAQKHYCSPAIAAYISTVAAQHSQTEEAETAINAAFTALLRQRTTDTLTVKERKLLMNSPYLLTEAVEITLKQSSSTLTTSDQQTTILKAVALTAIFIKLENYLVLSSLYENPTEMTAEQIIEGTSRIQHIVRKHAPILTGSTDLPVEYQTRIANLTLKQLVEELYLTKRVKDETQSPEATELRI